VEGTNDCNRPRAEKERLPKKKKKEEEEEGREDERGRAPESYLEWICLRVRCSPGATPLWESISAALAKGPEMDPQKMS
jgi:hypothetical protein